MPQLMNRLRRYSPVVAVLLAFVLGGALVLLGGHNPFYAYAVLIKGGFLDYYGFADTLVKTSPLLLCALAVAVPLRAGVYNIGATGQMYLGALFATLAAFSLGFLPPLLSVLACTIAGMCGGALWAALPAMLKVWRGTNEVITTLLLNYVAISLVNYIVSGPMLEEGAPYPYSPAVPESTQLLRILPSTDAHIGVAIAVIIACIVGIVRWKHQVGFSQMLVGENPAAARYAGVNVKLHVFTALVFGGAFAGIAGCYEVLGLKHRLYHQFAGSYGFDAIIVAFMARSNPFLCIPCALFLGGLISGANTMQRTVGVSATVVDAIEGLLIIFVAVALALEARKPQLSEV